jgi:hypothetical protein
MRSIATIGTNFSPAAYQGKRGKLATVPPQPSLAMHEFHANAQGCLEHIIDGHLRATVPPEGLDDYVRTWPDCAPVAKTLKAADH